MTDFKHGLPWAENEIESKINPETVKLIEIFESI